MSPDTVSTAGAWGVRKTEDQQRSALPSTNATAGRAHRSNQQLAKTSTFLFGRDRIFSPRPCSFCGHGTQGRVNHIRRERGTARLG